jgi:hypothetical protein
MSAAGERPKSNLLSAVPRRGTPALGILSGSLSAGRLAAEFVLLGLDADMRASLVAGELRNF